MEVEQYKWCYSLMKKVIIPLLPEMIPFPFVTSPVGYYECVYVATAEMNEKGETLYVLASIEAQPTMV